MFLNGAEKTLDKLEKAAYKIEKKRITRAVWKIAVVAVVGAGVALGFCGFDSVTAVLTILGL